MHTHARARAHTHTHTHSGSILEEGDSLSLAPRTLSSSSLSGRIPVHSPGQAAVLTQHVHAYVHSHEHPLKFVAHGLKAKSRATARREHLKAHAQAQSSMSPTHGHWPHSPGNYVVAQHPLDAKTAQRVADLRDIRMPNQKLSRQGLWEEGLSVNAD